MIVPVFRRLLPGSLRGSGGGGRVPGSGLFGGPGNGGGGRGFFFRRFRLPAAEREHFFEVLQRLALLRLFLLRRG